MAGPGNPKSIFPPAKSAVGNKQNPLSGAPSRGAPNGSRGPKERSLAAAILSPDPREASLRLLPSPFPRTTDVEDLEWLAAVPVDVALAIALTTLVTGESQMGVVEGVDHQIDAKLLMTLYPPGDVGTYQKDLAMRLDVHRATVSRSVRRLEAAGLVEVFYAGEYAITRLTVPKGRTAVLRLVRHAVAPLPDE